MVATDSQDAVSAKRDFLAWSQLCEQDIWVSSDDGTLGELFDLFALGFELEVAGVDVGVAV